MAVHKVPRTYCVCKVILQETRKNGVRYGHFTVSVLMIL